MTQQTDERIRELAPKVGLPWSYTWVCGSTIYDANNSPIATSEDVNEKGIEPKDDPYEFATLCANRAPELLEEVERLKAALGRLVRMIDRHRESYGYEKFHYVMDERPEWLAARIVLDPRCPKDSAQYEAIMGRVSSMAETLRMKHSLHDENYNAAVQAMIDAALTESKS